MAYTAEIGRANPTCILFVIDQSGSMAEQWGEGPKADTLATFVNRKLTDLVIQCTKSEETPRDYFYIGVLGYGANVGSSFSGKISGRDLVPISEIADNPAKIEERLKKIPNGAGGLVEEKVRFPIWLEPIASGGTPMCQVMGEANRILSEWLNEPDHADCFPPVLFHISDGESTDGDPTSIMKGINSLSSSDGNVIVFNVHLSSAYSGPTIRYPETDEVLPDQYASMMYHSAGFLTPNMVQVGVNEHGLSLSETSKAYVLNAKEEDTFIALDIGTRPSELR